MAQHLKNLLGLLGRRKGKGSVQAEEKDREQSNLEATKPYVLPSSREAYLELVSGVPAVGRVRLEEGLTVGRGVHCDVRLVGPEVSRVHARFVRAGLFWEIVDQGSTNGVFVNGQRVVNTRLQTGDRIEIGRAVLVFQER
ncbi:MAG: FHA domain-containing protein [Firmicutes bacterium]|jgi:hypothetical protein|nr:FHA domain-containing protein [Bacillota bacterium]NLO65775.1 FHA domain-containing protein [Bacillota bacterium]